METTQKEELRKVFDVWWRESTFDNQNTPSVDSMFTWFWKEIEAREVEIKTLTSENNDLACKNEDMENIDSEQVRELNSKISRLEATLEAAEEVVVKASGMISTTKPMPLRSFAVWGELNKALEKYNQLKAKK